MSSDTCALCGYWIGLHKSETLNCPISGQETNQYRTTTYVEESDLHDQVARLTAELTNLKETVREIKEILDDFEEEDVLAEVEMNELVDELQAFLDHMVRNGWTPVQYLADMDEGPIEVVQEDGWKYKLAKLITEDDDGWLTFRKGLALRSHLVHVTTLNGLNFLADWTVFKEDDGFNGVILQWQEESS